MVAFQVQSVPEAPPKHKRHAGGRIFYVEFSGASCSLPRVIYGPTRMPPVALASWRQEAGSIRRLRAIMFHVFLSHGAPWLLRRRGKRGRFVVCGDEIFKLWPIGTVDGVRVRTLGVAKNCRWHSRHSRPWAVQNVRLLVSWRTAARFPSIFHCPFITHFVCLFTILRVR
jgi:hypothetical protein